MRLLIMQSSPFSPTSCLLGPNILLSTLFSYTLNLYSSLNVRDFPCVAFRNKLVSYGKESLAPAQPQAGVPPLVGCPKLLIHGIRSSPTSISEAVYCNRNMRTRHAVVTLHSSNK
jgi:hypothetical protein